MNRLLPNEQFSKHLLKRYLDQHKRVSVRKKQLFLLLSSHSRFLGNCILRNPDTLDYLLKSSYINRDKSRDIYFKEILEILSSYKTSSNFFPRLRKYKYREISRIVIRDIKELCDFRTVMQELSYLADAIVECTFLHFKYNLLNGSDKCQFSILALGKLGGCELNLSSDIDLVYIFDSDDPSPSYKISEEITRNLSSISEEGFLYRVDLGLRPGGSKSPIAVSYEAALEHYSYWGETWERAALIKTRPIGGNLELGDRFIREIEPFVYKRNIDYTSIEELKDMKLKLDKLQKKDDVKLGKGGIREIEFFVQALQLVNGGTIRELRCRSTIDALINLKKLNLINTEVYNTLLNNYLFLRRVEHNIQLVDEIQTHKLPRGDEEVKKLSLRLGYESKKKFTIDFTENTIAVSDIYNSLFYNPSKKTDEIGKEFWRLADFLTEGNITEEETLNDLAKIGFNNTASALELISVLLDKKVGGFNEKANLISKRVISAFLAVVLKIPDPDSSLRNLESFISTIGSRSSIYSVLYENPEIITILSKFFSTNGYLTKFLIKYPEYLDILTLRDVRKEYGSKEDMQIELRLMLSEGSGLEYKLDTLRRFKHLETLKLCLRDLNNEVNPQYIGNYLSSLAEAILEDAFEIALDEIASKKKKGLLRNMVILGMGKLGGKELSYNSDLDLIFVYEGEEQVLFSKLGQKIISYLSIPTAEGYAYVIDMDLRPSGKSGALVSSFSSFKTYHQKSSWLWEKQALIRARPVAGNKKLGRKVMRTISKFVYEKSLEDNFHLEIAGLRERMEREIAKETKNKLNLKTGKGGIVDIEFIVQMLQLRYGKQYKSIRSPNTFSALEEIRKKELISEKDFKILNEGLIFLKKMENLLKLLHDRSITEIYESDFDKMALEWEKNLNGDKLKNLYINNTDKIRRVFKKYFA